MKNYVALKKRRFFPRILQVRVATHVMEEGVHLTTLFPIGLVMLLDSVVSLAPM